MSSNPSFLLAAVDLDSAKPAIDDTCPSTWSMADRTAWEHRQTG